MFCMHMYNARSDMTSFRLNPLVTNGLSHPYHLDEFIFIFRGIRSNFSFFTGVFIIYLFLL